MIAGSLTAAARRQPAVALRHARAARDLRDTATASELLVAGHLTGQDGDDAAAAAIGEARDIAGCLCCQPLLGRAADIAPTQSQLRA